MSHKHILGSFGERIAQEYLVKKGYVFIAKHFTTRYGEIDIIMQHGNRIVFVEVKARSSKTFGLPEEAITKHKLQKIKNTLQVFRAEHREYAQLTPTIEAVSILFNAHNEPQIIHIENIV